jgi:copper homeostasis protein
LSNLIVIVQNPIQFHAQFVYAHHRGNLMNDQFPPPVTRRVDLSGSDDCEPFGMTRPILEICVESLESALVAEAGGADRVELCEQLAIDGVTPSPELIRQVLAALKIPVYILIRPRGGSFVYKSSELDQMKAEVNFAKLAGAAGVTLGILKPDQTVDIELTRELVLFAHPMPVTFHRAFDVVPNQTQGLEDVIKTGAERLLTSGGAPNVLAGAAAIARLREQAAGRIEVMAGGGLRITNLLEVRRRTGVHCLHTSLLNRSNAAIASSGEVAEIAAKLHETDVREASRLLRMELQRA